MPVALEWLVSTEHVAGAVPVIIDGVDIDVEVLADVDVEVDVDAKVDVDPEVDVHPEVDAMVK